MSLRHADKRPEL